MPFFESFLQRIEETLDLKALKHLLELAEFLSTGG